MSLNLPTLADIAAEPFEARQKRLQKPIPTPLAKVERKKTKAAREAAFRLGVWERDKGHSRASKKPLAKSGTDYERVGEIHHVLARSTAPDRVFDVSNGILLSKHEHHLAETNCPGDPAKCLLDILGPEDRGQLQTFVWHDVTGKELRRRIG